MIEPQDGAERLRETWDRFTRGLVRPPRCEACTAVHACWDGWSTRTASAMDNGKVWHVRGLRLRRAECGKCGYQWIVRPPGLVAHKHYQLCVVAAAAGEYLFEPASTQAQVAEEHGCSTRTLSRWLRWIGQVAVPAAIQARILDVVGEPVLAPVRAVANLARKARTTIRRAVLPAAAEVLCQLEALGMALGLEPPGLREVIVSTLRDRSGIATYARPLIPEFGKVTS